MMELEILAAFFTCVMGLITAAGWVWMRRAAGSAGEMALASPPASGGAVTELFRLVGGAVPASPDEQGVVRRRLVAAGYRSHATVPLFYGLKCGSAMLLTLLLGWGTFVVRDSVTTALVPALAAAFFGYTLPDRILQRLTRARAGRIRRALPDALDLLVLCIESGHSLDQGLIDTGTELKRSHPDLASELTRVHLELRAGTSRSDALRHLAARNREPELRKLANLLIQADRFGTSLGPALRVHARYLRLRTKQQAEEVARKISIKLLFPIFFLIFPTMMLVTAGPAILQIFTQLIPMINSSME